MTPHLRAGLNDLVDHLRSDRLVKLFGALDDRFRGVHLKDMVVEEMGQNREMAVGGRRVINFGCDSFLGLDRDARIQNAIIAGVKKWGTFSGASRIFYSVEACQRAEAKLAKWLGVEATLLYPSTTAANAGALPGLVRPGDLLVVERLAHDSIHQAAKIAQANGTRVVELWPCMPEALVALLDQHKYQCCVVAVDGVYSMLGTSPPLKELNEVVRRHRGILYIDDAHGMGVCGGKGRGAAHSILGRLDDVVIAGSLSKAFSCAGAFVTCTHDLKFLLKVKSNNYLFSGPIPPPYVEAICTACDIIMSPEYEVIASRLNGLVQRFADGARQLGLHVLGGQMPIVSILVRDGERALRAGKWLFDRGYYVQAVMYPAVPLYEAVLRVQINANHTWEMIDGLLGALADLRQVMPLPAPDRVAIA